MTFNKTETSVCDSCGRRFFYVRFATRGRPRKYCDECGRKISREKSAARMRKLRASKPPKQNRTADQAGSPVSSVGFRQHSTDQIAAQYAISPEVYRLDWQAIERHVDLLMSPIGFLFS
jgi:hypothetical protein